MLSSLIEKGGFLEGYAALLGWTGVKVEGGGNRGREGF